MTNLSDVLQFYIVGVYACVYTARNGPRTAKKGDGSPAWFRRVLKLRGVCVLYAIIETGGKQYRVQEGDTLYVEKLPAGAGDAVTIDKVFAVVKDDGELVAGTPLVPGASVIFKVVRHGRGKKIIVFKYKAKKNYRRKQGHRQAFTQVTVEKIQV